MGIERHDLPQAFFTLGLVVGDGAQPQPGRFVARLGDENQIENIAGFLIQPALGSLDALRQQFFSVHRIGCNWDADLLGGKTSRSCALRPNIF